jgi:hypothetical protein
MANQSGIKSDQLRVMENKLQQLQAREQEVEAQAIENAKVRYERDTLKLEHTHEIWLLTKEIENLKDKNRLQAKSHRGDTLSTSLS